MLLLKLLIPILITSCGVTYVADKKINELPFQPSEEQIEASGSEDLNPTEIKEENEEPKEENGFKIDPNNIQLAKLANDPIMIAVVKGLYIGMIPKIKESTEKYIPNVDEVDFESIFDKTIDLAKTVEAVKFSEIIDEMSPGFIEILAEDPILGTEENKKVIDTFKGPIIAIIKLAGPSLLEKGVANLNPSEVLFSFLK